MKVSQLVVGGIYKLNHYSNNDLGRVRFSAVGRNVDVKYIGSCKKYDRAADFNYLIYRFLIIDSEFSENPEVWMNDVTVWQMVKSHPKYSYVDNQKLISSLEDIYAAV
jgi:hypothetical protein